MNDLNNKLKMIGLSLVMMLSMFVIDFFIFGNNQALAENHNYDGKSPNYNSCASSAVTKDTKWIDSVSYVELKFSTTCKTAWAKVTVTRPAVYNHEADARIVRSTDGKAYTCNSTGGNGVVNKGQTSCYTPMVYDLDPRKAQAQGIHAIPNSDAYKKAVTIWY
ncbi:YjfA family protein [Peribacillus butanolivorans]|uniref:YjfA family protein n=3 Tax=Bacillaceae TaxID=186817 RepID=UPI00365E4442